MPITIGFHDVVEGAEEARPIRPGFTTAYTLRRQHLRECLAAIQSRTRVQSVRRVDASVPPNRDAVFLTVDDGRLSTFTILAPELEDFGWRGHFFITTDWIGLPGFLNENQIRELHHRGHLIGSHSCSHPSRMWSLPYENLLREWGQSRNQLSDILGQEVLCASVPGGYHSRGVGQAVAESGYDTLFTSEPTTVVSMIDGCRIYGRYTVRRHTSAANVGAIAAGARWSRWKQTAGWAATKAAKRVIGKRYLRLRRGLLDLGTPASHSNAER